MPRLYRSFAAAPAIALVAFIALSGAPRPALAGGVRDDARVFDADTVSRVNDIIGQIKKRYGRDLAVETFDHIPADLQARFAAENKETFYEHWMQQEARKAHNNGIFILLVKRPGHLQIGVGNDTRKEAFTEKDRDALRDLMVEKLKDGHFDEGLTAAAQFVLERLEKNQPGAGNAPPPVSLPAATEPGQPQLVHSQPATRPSTAPATEPATSPYLKPAPASGADPQPRPSAGAGLESSK